MTQAKKKKGFWSRKWAALKRTATVVTMFLVRVLLVPVYLIGIGLTALLGRILGKRFLSLKPEQGETYWQPRQPAEPNMDRLHRQF